MASIDSKSPGSVSLFMRVSSRTAADRRLVCTRRSPCASSPSSLSTTLWETPSHGNVWLSRLELSAVFSLLWRSPFSVCLSSYGLQDKETLRKRWRSSLLSCLWCRCLLQGRFMWSEQTQTLIHSCFWLMWRLNVFAWSVFQPASSSSSSPVQRGSRQSSGGHGPPSAAVVLLPHGSASGHPEFTWRMTWNDEQWKWNLFLLSRCSPVFSKNRGWSSSHLIGPSSLW